MKISSESKFFKEVEKDKAYLIQYGAISRGSNTDVVIFVEDASYLSATKSCQCTQPSVEILDNGFKLTIKYDNNKIGTINQFAKVKVLENKEQKEIKFDLRGQIL